MCEDWFENHVIVVSLRDRCFMLYVVGKESFVELANGPQPRSFDWNENFSFQEDRIAVRCSALKTRNTNGRPPQLPLRFSVLTASKMSIFFQ